MSLVASDTIHLTVAQCSQSFLFTPILEKQFSGLASNTLVTRQS